MNRIEVIRNRTSYRPRCLRVGNISKEGEKLQSNMR